MKLPFFRPGYSVPRKEIRRRRLLPDLRKLQSLGPEWLLFLAAAAVYALVVGTGITRYPIYFFTDEAVHMNMAAYFIHNHFQNYYHEFLPTFFSMQGWMNGTSVYVQVLPYLLFGKSILVTRLVSAAITLLGAIALGLMLKRTFKIVYSWAGILLLLITPAWFLHARTAFEYAEVASFYSLFLYFYSRYRDGDLRAFYAALVAGALAFYTHGLGQVLMGVTGAALFLVDFRYHLHPDRRKTLLLGLGLAVLLLLPFLRYFLAHSNEFVEQVQRRDSYWTNGNLTILQKVGEFIGQYLYGLSPQYWYFHNSVDIERHIMKGYGNGLWVTLPFAVIGLVQSIRRIRQFPYRIALIAFFAAPVPASIVAIGMPRMLWMSIPLALFTALGLSACLEWLESRRKSLAHWLPPAVFALLTLTSLYILRDALVNGPTWFEDYGLYGMQYGAQQVFEDTLLPDLEMNPDLRYVVSPSWANGAENFTDFFIPQALQSRVSFGQPIDLVDGLERIANPQIVITTDNRTTILQLHVRPAGFPANLRFVVTSNEYDKLLKDAKFTDIRVYKTIPFPDGTPGFYVLSLEPVGNIADILAAEHLKNRMPVEDSLQLNGQLIRVLHSPFGSGDLEAVFDHDPNTLASVLEANPFTFDLYPTTPMSLHGVSIQTGSLDDFTVTVSLYAPGAATPIVYSKTYQGLPPDPRVSLTFDRGPAWSARIDIEIKDNRSGETSQIHVRTIEFK
jgi:hypothetical protein